MNARKQNKIDWALSVLGLKEPLDEASVIDRMNGIRQSWEEQQGPEVWKAMRDAQEAGNLLLQKIEADELEKSATETVDPLLYYVSPEIAEAVRIKEKKRRTKIGLIAATILLIALAYGIPQAVENRRNQMVEDIMVLRSTMNWHNYTLMGKYLDNLKNDPRVEAVRSDYELIKADLNVFTRLNPQADPSERREAYYRLLAFDEAHPAWYLLGLLNLNENYQILIWESRFETDGVWFELNADLTIDTNLPASYEILFPYELEISANYRDFDMVNQANLEDRVNMYRIQSVTQTELRIYCYFNQQIYVLSRIGS